MDVAVCDFDGDGQDDLARLILAPSGRTEVRIHPGPILDPFDPFDLPEGSRLRTLGRILEGACGDWDGNSTADIVVSTYGSEGGKLGVFLDPQDQDVDGVDVDLALNGGTAWELAMRDLDGDGWTSSGSAGSRRRASTRA